MRLFVVSVLAAGLLLLTGATCNARQDSTRRGITVTGSSRIYSQFSTRAGNYQELPRNFIRWELNNNLNFYGIPIVSSIYLSTEQSSSRQNISGFRIGLDARSIARNKLYEKFRFLNWFPTLEAGNCRPVYSVFTLNGVTLRGVNVEFNPGPFYTAFATGRLQRAVQSGLPSMQLYDRNLTFGRLGGGKSRSVFFALSLLHAKDDPESMKPDPYWYQRQPDTLVYNAETFIHGRDSGAIYILPRENYVASFAMNLPLFRRRLTITGELAGSLTHANQNAYGFTFDEIPERYQDRIFVNASSRADYAWMASAVLKLPETQAEAVVRHVGPGFVSLGTAWLRTDVEQYEGSIIQYFKRKQIRFQAWYKGSRDNLSGWKSSTVDYSNCGANASFRFRRAPWFTLLYAPYRSGYDTPEGKVNFEATNYTFTAGMQHRIKAATAMTQGMVSLQEGMGNLPAGGTEMKNLNLMLSETVTLKAPFALFASVSMNDLKSTQIDRKTLTLNGKITYRGVRWMNNQAGVSLTSWSEQLSRFRYYLHTLIDMGKFGSLTFQAERNNLENFAAPERSFKEYIFRVGFSHRW